MLCYNRKDISEGIDPVKSNYSKECMVFHYWSFNRVFQFQDSVCNSCHNLMILCLNVSNIAIITVKVVDYHYITRDMSKSEAFQFDKFNWKIW